MSARAPADPGARRVTVSLVVIGNEVLSGKVEEQNAAFLIKRFRALGARLRGSDARTFVLVSDGECNEGSTWEAAMMAGAQRLERLTVIVDFNKWQATGRSREVLALDPLPAKWAAFGWQAEEVDGHDLDAVRAALARPPDGSGRPRAIVAHTVKGKGVSFMEDDNNWHYRTPSPDEVAAAKRELGVA